MIFLTTKASLLGSSPTDLTYELSSIWVAFCVFAILPNGQLADWLPSVASLFELTLSVIQQSVILFSNLKCVCIQFALFVISPSGFFDVLLGGLLGACAAWLLFQWLLDLLMWLSKHICGHARISSANVN